jgi:DHA1 family tetracycline resistance protein-like MFS transporter
MLFLGRIIDGITGGNISTAQAYIADVTTPENRAKGMGMIGAAFGRFILGPGLGGVLSRWGINVPFICRRTRLLQRDTSLFYFARNRHEGSSGARLGGNRQMVAASAILSSAVSPSCF